MHKTPAFDPDAFEAASQCRSEAFAQSAVIDRKSGYGYVNVARSEKNPRVFLISFTGWTENRSFKTVTVAVDPTMAFIILNNLSNSLTSAFDEMRDN